ncbi:MAG TPA: heat-inducible transcriptional repressor HrcA [Gemmatimonadales bacterium]|jgi:heat-inducible transcriptional repressor
MNDVHSLTERERRVLEAVIETYIATAEPAGSNTVARRSTLGISSASIRSTMSELEGKGFLYHPHTSAGRIPTDRAYRVYVDAMLGRVPPAPDLCEHLEIELTAGLSGDDLLLRAAQVLGILTQELGVAVAPAFEAIVLQRVDLVAVSSDRLLVVLNLQSGTVRSIYIRLRGALERDRIDDLQRLLNERLAGLTLRDIRSSYADRLRDAGTTPDLADLLDIIVAEGEEIFELPTSRDAVVLGNASVLVDQPEFATSEQMRSLLTLTERSGLLRDALAERKREGLTVTIGGEHEEPGLAAFTLVTSTYRRGSATGVIGVLGPTRMPYDKIVGLVEHTGRLIEGLIQ